jgi:16S rRNA (guanine527-N7)-methyltransferase
MVSDKAAALAITPVSRETESKLQGIVDNLTRWQKIKNLVGPSTLDEVWLRHIADSLQIAAAAPDAKVWADFGSGAGFPGLVIAATLIGVPGARVHLVESNDRKSAFLRETARLLGLPVTVHPERIEEVVNRLPPVEIVTARALAPLNDLLEMTSPLLAKGAVALFPKGQDLANELTEASKCWKIRAIELPSLTDPKARILRVEQADKRVGAEGDDTN